MKINMHTLSISFRKFRSAIEDLDMNREWFRTIVELDVAIDKVFCDATELTPDLERNISDQFSFLLERIGALSEYLAARIDEVQKLMIAAAALEEKDSDFQRWSTELDMLLGRFQNVSVILRVFREIRKSSASWQQQAADA